MAILDLLLGRPLSDDEAEHQQIGPLAGVPVLGLDALSSAAYGPVATLTLLLPLGRGGAAGARADGAPHPVPPALHALRRLRPRHARPQPQRDVVVIIPDLVVAHWYQHLLHNNRGAILRALLRLRRGPRVIVLNTPFQLDA